MRKLTYAIVFFALAAAGWGAYWFVGATATERALAAWLETRAAEGWIATSQSLDTRGFPNRFDITITGLELADPDTETAWSADLFQLFSLSYKPLHVLAHWPGAQRFSSADQTVTLTSEDMRGSFVLAAHPDLPVQSSTITFEGTDALSSKGWTAHLAQGQLSMRVNPAASDPTLYDLYATAQELTLSDTLLADLGNSATLPETVANATVDMQVKFSAPWDRRALEVARPQPREVTLNSLAARWGALDLSAAGALSIDRTGQPTGEIEVKAVNWREMVALAETSGALTADSAAALRAVLGLLAAGGDDPQTLKITLRYARGLVYAGPLPIGTAPKVALP